MSTERTARELYESGPTARPSWDSLGEVTKSVWREYAERKLQGDPQWWSTQPTAAPKKPKTKWPMVTRRKES